MALQSAVGKGIALFLWVYHYLFTVKLAGLHFLIALEARDLVVLSNGGPMMLQGAEIPIVWTLGPVPDDISRFPIGSSPLLIQENGGKPLLRD